MATIDVPKATANNVDNFRATANWDGNKYTRTGLAVAAYGNYNYVWHPDLEVIKVSKTGQLAELIITDGKVVGVSWTMSGPAGAQERVLANRASWTTTDSTTITQAKTRAIVEAVLADIATLQAANATAPAAAAENAAAIESAL